MIEYENLSILNSRFKEDLQKAANQVIDKGMLILGPEVTSFENEFAEWMSKNSNKASEKQYCIGLASGLDALTLSLAALDLPKGSEVLVPSNTYIATILSIVQAGHKPVLVEPDIATYNINPAHIEKHITSNSRALMIVHLYGQSCEMDAILSICKKHSLHLIEDCAQSHGAEFNGQKTGTFGIGAFSFYPTKNLGAFGDAGAVICHDETFAKKIKSLRNYGSEKKYYNDHIGWNSRLDEMQAGLLRVKLKFLDQLNLHKQKLANIYHTEIQERFIKPLPLKKNNHVYHIYNIRHEARDRLREHLLNKGIKTDIHYPVAPHLQTAYKDMFKGQSFPISEEIHLTTLSLPISLIHSETDIKTVAQAINSF
jgi:dTDP-4-amino-4,6-dideoxygalactose transaminase